MTAVYFLRYTGDNGIDLVITSGRRFSTANDSGKKSIHKYNSQRLNTAATMKGRRTP